MYVTDAVILLIMLSCLCSMATAQANSQRKGANNFHFPNAQDSNLSDDKSQNNVHRIIFGVSDLDNLTTLSNINEVK